MHFYRPLQRPAALTFDLDDTLYDNHPVIVRSEQAALDFYAAASPPCRISRALTGSACALNCVPAIRKSTMT